MVNTNYPKPSLDNKKLAIIGNGNLTKAVLRLVAAVNASNGADATQVFVYTRQPSLGSLSPPVGVVFTNHLSEVIQRARIILVAVPATALADVAQKLSPHVLPDQVILLVSRGITEGFYLPSDLIRAHTCLRKIGIIGGPLHVREIEVGRRMNAVIASKFDEVIQVVRAFTGMGAISFQHTRDVVGVQIIGALANTAYIAAGAAEALGLGQTARGVLIARGIIEARIVGASFGANPETFFGLAGLGELIPRSVTSLERHIQFGRLLGQGIYPKEAAEQIADHLEGATSTKVVAEWSKTKSISLPLITAISDVLDQKAQLADQLDAVLSKPL
ncbi:MAG: NAD(P)-binding domain-containing protein [Myxococcales bacterium]|nr:NAD(P)-binding domain-containing protein [Myxococcales bacterium]